jgi:hypothetical protein
METVVGESFRKTTVVTSVVGVVVVSGEVVVIDRPGLILAKGEMGAEKHTAVKTLSLKSPDMYDNQLHDQ